MKNKVNYILVCGLIFGLGSILVSYGHFYYQAKKVEKLLDIAFSAKLEGKNGKNYIEQAAKLMMRGFYFNNWKTASVCTEMGNIYLDELKYEPAASWYHFDERIVKKGNDTKSLVFTYEKLGNVYRFLNNWTASKNYYENAIELINKFQQHGLNIRNEYNPRVLGAIYYGLGITEYFWRNNELALKYLRVSEKYFSELSNRERKNAYLADIYQSYGYCYLKLKKYDEAENSLKKAVFYYQETSDNLTYLINCHILLADINFTMNNTEGAKKYIKKVETLSKDEILSDSVYNKLVRIESKLNNK